MLKLAFSDVDAVLKVNGGEHGKVSQIAYKGEEDGKFLYDVYTSLDMGYQLVSYTVKDETEPVLLNLTTDNYDSRDEKGIIFPMSIEKDTEITLNYALATLDLELWSYVPDTSNKAQIASYWYSMHFNHLFKNGKDLLLEKFNANADSVPLVEGMAEQFWIKVNINGFMELASAESSEEYDSVLKMYSGDTVSDENLFFDSTDPDTVCDSGHPLGYGIRDIISGRKPAGIYVTVMSCPDMDKITVWLKFGGYEL